MAVDIVPGLLDAIGAAFALALEADRRYTRIAGRIRDGTATLADVHETSVVVGETLSGVLLKMFTPAAMPDGVYYWNIVERVLSQTLGRNHALVNETGRAAMEALNAREGIGLTALFADFPEERAKGLMEKIVADEINPMRWLGEPIVNISESMSDDFMQINAEATAAAGMQARIVRTLGAAETRTSHKRTYEIPCEWCAALAGTYVYGEEPPEVYQRHESCRCVVTFERNRLRQNVTTRRWYTETGQSVLTANADAYRRTPAEAREFEAAFAEEQRRIERERRRRLIEDHAATTQRS